MEIDDLFNRQRGNLFIISIIMLFINLAGVDIKNEISFSGIKFIVNDFELIHMFLWGMFYYFILRYFQYYISLSKNQRDYGFSFNYLFLINSFHDFKVIRSKFSRLLLILITILKFLFYVLESITAFVITVIFEKNFLERLFPLIFAVLVVFISWKTPFYMKKEIIMLEKINLFIDRTVEIVYMKNIEQINQKINKKKKEVNDFVGFELFESKKNETKFPYSYYYYSADK